jgi:hypothetical protein
MSELGVRLRQFVKANGRRVIQSSLIAKDGFRFEDDVLSKIRDKFVVLTGTPIGKLFNVRLGGLTGCDKAFVLDEETANKFLQEDKYKEYIKPILRGRDIDNGDIHSTMFMLYFPHGFTNEFIAYGESAEDWFKANYYEAWLHLSKFDNIETKGKGVRTRDDSCMGDYWWELSNSRFGSYFDQGGVVLSLISEEFNLVRYQSGFLPLNSLITINGEIPSQVIDFLNNELFFGLYKYCISISSVGDAVIKNTSLVSSVIYPYELVNNPEMTVTNAVLQRLYGFTDAEVDYLIGVKGVI